MTSLSRLSILPIVLLVAGLAACTATSSPRPEVTRSTPVANPTTSTTAPTPWPTVEPDPVIRSEGHVIGTGELTGPITGEVTITPTDLNTITIRLDGLQFHGSTARQLILSSSAKLAAAATDGMSFREGDLSSAQSQQVTASTPSVNEYMDLSDMHSLRIQADVSDASANSTALLRWSVPTDLATIRARDSGRRYGATGHLAHTSSGVPQTYTVAKDDLLDNVAQRFNLTPDELLWLNPFRSRRDSGLLYSGEVLNLDPTRRG